MNKQEIRAVQFPPGEIEPLFVAARDVPKLIIGLSTKTLANWRSQKIGPPYHSVNGVVYYQLRGRNESRRDRNWWRASG